MNYLTNYYKNLSEQLQEKVTILESYLHKMNEDLEPGTIVQGYGASNTSTTTNQNDNAGLNSLLQAWGSSDPTYDYNGDGVVDGNDLGIYLARMVGGNGGSTPTTMASTAMRGTPGAETPATPAGTPKKMKALDQAATAKTPFAGTYNAGAGSQIPRDVVGKNPKETSSKKGSGADLTQVTNVGYPSAPKPKTPTKTTPEMTIATMLNRKGMMAPTSNLGNGRTTPPTNYTPQKPKLPLSVDVQSEPGEISKYKKPTTQTPTNTTGNFTTKAGTQFDGDLNGNGYDYQDFAVFLQGFNRGVNSNDPDWDLMWAQWDYNGDGRLDGDDLGYWSGLLPPTNDGEEEEGEEETEQFLPRPPVNQMKTTDAGLENVEFRGRTQQKRKR